MVEHPKKPWFHIFNPFNGTPFKTAMIMVVMCFVFLMASFMLYKKTNDKVLPYAPILSESNFDVQENQVSIASNSYHSISKICTSEAVTALISTYWTQDFGKSIGAAIPADISVPTPLASGCAVVNKTGSIPTSVTPGNWKITSSIVVLQGGTNKFQITSTDSKEFTVIP